MVTHEIQPGDWREGNDELTSLKLADVRSVPYDAKENGEITYVQYLTVGMGETIIFLKQFQQFQFQKCNSYK
jgi:hypothetical protein